MKNSLRKFIRTQHPIRIDVQVNIMLVHAKNVLLREPVGVFYIQIAEL